MRIGLFVFGWLITMTFCSLCEARVEYKHFSPELAAKHAADFWNRSHTIQKMIDALVPAITVEEEKGLRAAFDKNFLTQSLPEVFAIKDSVYLKSTRTRLLSFLKDRSVNLYNGRLIKLSDKTMDQVVSDVSLNERPIHPSFLGNLFFPYAYGEGGWSGLVNDCKQDQALIAAQKAVNPGNTSSLSIAQLCIIPIDKALKALGVSELDEKTGIVSQAPAKTAMAQAKVTASGSGACTVSVGGSQFESNVAPCSPEEAAALQADMRTMGSPRQQQGTGAQGAVSLLEHTPQPQGSF